MKDVDQPQNKSGAKKLLAGLTALQRQQVERQLRYHLHQTYAVDIRLGPGAVLRQFAVHKDVYRPERMCTLVIARYLHRHAHLYAGKRVLDLGCGSGLQGVVMGLGNAASVALSDISQAAVANSADNVSRFRLAHAAVCQSDLFDHVPGSFDLIVLNHPFFPADPIPGNLVSCSMLNNGELLTRFLAEAKAHLRKSGSIIMPFLELAGSVNDPNIHAKTFGYIVEVLMRTYLSNGIQRGRFFLYRLRPVQ